MTAITHLIHADEAFAAALAESRKVADAYLSNDLADAFDCAHGAECGECSGCCHLAAWNLNLAEATAKLERAREDARMRALRAVLA